MKIVFNSSIQFKSTIVFGTLIFLGGCKSADCGCPMAVENKKQVAKKEQIVNSKNYEIKAVTLKSK